MILFTIAHITAIAYNTALSKTIRGAMDAVGLYFYYSFECSALLSRDFVHTYTCSSALKHASRVRPSTTRNKSKYFTRMLRVIPTRRFFFPLSILSRFLSRPMQFHFSLFSGSDDAIPSRSNEQFPANSVTFNDLIRHVSRTVWSNFFYRCKRRQTIFQLRVTIGNCAMLVKNSFRPK